MVGSYNHAGSVIVLRDVFVVLDENDEELGGAPTLEEARTLAKDIARDRR